MVLAGQEEVNVSIVVKIPENNLDYIKINVGQHPGRSCDVGEDTVAVVLHETTRSTVVPNKHIEVSIVVDVSKIDRPGLGTIGQTCR
ncbi:MAG: hypothetical protein AAF492_24325, partial [Verrucomicrobiota bacterium]